MNYDEFAFFNQQLAAMLRDGIPLEGALAKLSRDMRAGSLRREIDQLTDDLQRGTPLPEALAARRLPDVYKRLVVVGAKSNDMPGALTLLADHYQGQHNLWTRLKGLMVYPTIVMVVGFIVSVISYFAWTFYLHGAWLSFLTGWWEGAQLPAVARLTLPMLDNLWIFPVFFACLCAFQLSILFVPRLRESIGWKLPAFREARIAQAASTIGMLLKGGLPLPESLGVAGDLETNTATRVELRRWEQNLSSGITKFPQIAGGGSVFPPLFVWLVSGTGEDLSEGFRHAAEIYRNRAIHRGEVLLFAALPMSVLLLGLIILTQGWLIFSGFTMFIQLLNMMAAT